MNVYVLESNGSKIAMCKDKFLIELFIVQRKIKQFSVEARNAKKEIKLYNTYLVYYYGYAMTMREMEFITELKAFIEKHRKFLKKKEVETIKKTIRIFKDKKKNKNLIFSKEMVDMVINEPGMVEEYLDNLEMFKNCMEGEY